MTFDDWMAGVAPAHRPTDDTVMLRILRQCWIEARADERERCATVCEERAKEEVGGAYADIALDCALAIRATQPTQGATEGQ